MRICFFLPHFLMIRIYQTRGSVFHQHIQTPRSGFANWIPDETLLIITIKTYIPQLSMAHDQMHFTIS